MNGATINPWPNFDFRALDDPHFKEDAVREELIAPLLQVLGYRAIGLHQIVRSPSLLHPFVYIGSKKHRINIIPDYLLRRAGRPLCILDAKAPGENIEKGKAVEQAYSYAIHKDVRVGLYGLCNGHELILYHVSRHPSLVHCELKDIHQHWALLQHYLGSESTADGNLPPDYKPDFGLQVHKIGFAIAPNGKPYAQLFPFVAVGCVGRVSKDTFCINSIVGEPDDQLFATFDFSAALFEDFLKAMPSPMHKDLRKALKKVHSTVYFQGGPPPIVGIFARLSSMPITNDKESYCPFLVEKFI